MNIVMRLRPRSGMTMPPPSHINSGRRGAAPAGSPEEDWCRAVKELRSRALGL